MKSLEGKAQKMRRKIFSWLRLTVKCQWLVALKARRSFSLEWNCVRVCGCSLLSFPGPPLLPSVGELWGSVLFCTNSLLHQPPSPCPFVCFMLLWYPSSSSSPSPPQLVFHYLPYSSLFILFFSLCLSFRFSLSLSFSFLPFSILAFEIRNDRQGQEWTQTRRRGKILRRKREVPLFVFSSFDPFCPASDHGSWARDLWNRGALTRIVFPLFSLWRCVLLICIIKDFLSRVSSVKFLSWQKKRVAYSASAKRLSVNQNLKMPPMAAFNCSGHIWRTGRVAIENFPLAFRPVKVN